MVFHQFKVCTFFVMLLVAANTNAVAGFITYNGSAVVEANWQSAAGATSLEDFQGYSAGTQISSLPALGVGFDVLNGGGYPATYLHHEDNSPYGRMHLGNFPNGINAINRWDDISLFVLPGYEITALGFWNGDGQRDTLVASVYDASNNLLGSVGAFKGTFAGFISDISIARVVFDGNTGDGWNHLDGLQTNVSSNISVPEPATLGLFLLGVIGLARCRIKFKG